MAPMENKMNATLSTQPPASEKRPVALLDGRPYNPSQAAPDGRPAAEHLRAALYSGQIPASLWTAAERFIHASKHREGESRGGSATGAKKKRGGKAYYAWVVACRWAKAKGLPKPDRPKIRARAAT